VADGIAIRIVNETRLDGFLKNVAGIVKRPVKLMEGISQYIDRATDDTFKSSGARLGDRWKPLSRDTVYTRAGTRRIKYGTRRAPKRTRAELNRYKKGLGRSQFQRGPMRGYGGHKRYGSPLDPPMQASGDFRNSFRVLQLSAAGFRYGTTFDTRLASAIMKDRPVLRFTGTDRRKVANLMAHWIRKGLV
jgi:hypothetical protein